MSAIQGKTDFENTFLSRREITCDFNGLGGSLTKLQALEMVTKEYNLGGKTVIPIILKNHVGRTQITGTFYVYEDEKLAKSHIIPNILARLEKANAKAAEKIEAAAKEKASADEAAKEKASADEAAKEKASADEAAKEKTDAPAKKDDKQDAKSDKEVSS